METEITDSVESEVVEPQTDVQEMSDQEFDEYMDKDTAESSEGTLEEPESVDLDGLYKAQMDNSDSVLDKPMLIKINGKVTEINNVNDMKDLMERGLGATKSFQQIAEHKKTIQFLEDNNLSMEDLNQLVTANGNEPITQDETAVQVETVAQTILDSDYASDFKSTADMLPDDIREQMGKNPGLLKDFYGDVQSGLAQQIMPKVEQLMAIKGMDFFQAYGVAGQALNNNNTDMEQKKQTLRSQPKPNSQSLDSNNTDIWSMSDSEFDKYMN